MAKIYTRTGDSGDTGLFGGQRVRKNDARVEAYGTVDELCCALGLASAECGDEEIKSILTSIQNQLFVLGGDLATPFEAGETHGRATVTRVRGDAAAELEPIIDRFEAELEPLRRFILPGGGSTAGYLHFSRAVCRRAERRCVDLAETESVNPAVVVYLNRLSDLLFVMARLANHRAGIEDVPWELSPDSSKEHDE